MNSLINDLKKLSCAVISDAVSRKLYSVDASIYEVEPQVVVLPRTKKDFIDAVTISKKHNIPVTVRGAATGITGGCLGSGVVIDITHLNKVLDIDYEKKIATVEPGVVQDHLNDLLKDKGLRLGPDTSTGNRATIGGMVANNACGAHALKYGRMVDAVVEVEVLLSSGELVRFRELTPKEWKEKLTLQTHEGAIYREVERLKKTYADEIQKNFPKLPRRASGYNLDFLLKPNFTNLSKLIVGSEGSLGCITEVTLELADRPKHLAMVLIGSSNMLQTLSSIPRFLEKKPYALEMIDKRIIDTGKISPSLRGKIDFLQSSPDALFIVEFEADSEQEVKKKCVDFEESLPKSSDILWTKSLFDADTQQGVWQLRKSGLGLLLSERSFRRAVAFIEDISIHPSKLSDFVTKLTSYLQEDFGIYGHVGDGGLHIRPYLDLRKNGDIKRMEKIMHDISHIVKEFGGALSSEHGDGLVRSWTNPYMFGEKLYRAFQELKMAFDPDGIMNPGKVISTQTLTENLRFSPQKNSFSPFFNFDREGGFHLAVDLCNGNGQCRKKEGLMCPSFQVTGDEKDSTRARANAFRSFMDGKLQKTDLYGQEFHDVMDLCIQCKGCKTECPSQVDMAKIKSEYLHFYHEKKGHPFRSYLFGYIGKMFQYASLLPWFANAALTITRPLMSLFGITSKRSLPKVSKKRFSKEQRQPFLSEKKVVLFIDTFTEFLTPEIGMSALQLLQKLGYEVITPSWTCCGRTLISKGFLEDAQKSAQKLVDLLYPYAQKGLFIVGIEPSCILTLRDEFRDFHLDKEQVEMIRKQSLTLDEFIEKHLPLPFSSFEKEVLVHTHCHQKALIGSSPTMKILRSIPQIRVQEIPSGCCGMAGSFGYEKEHYEVSQKLARLVLFPTLEKKPHAHVIASGASCRSQIGDSGLSEPEHLAVFLNSLL